MSLALAQQSISSLLLFHTWEKPKRDSDYGSRRLTAFYPSSALYIEHINFRHIVFSSVHKLIIYIILTVVSVYTKIPFLVLVQL